MRTQQIRIVVLGLAMVLMASCKTKIRTVINPPVGELEFAATSFGLAEGGVNELTLRRVNGSFGALSVTVSFADGTANGSAPPLAAPYDFDTTPVVVTFADGDTTDKVVAVPIFDDNIVEGEETFTAQFPIPMVGTSPAIYRYANLSITDNDSAGLLQLSSGTYSYNESGTPIVEIIVERTGGNDGSVSGVVMSSDQTANSTTASFVEPVDFTPLYFTVSFADQDVTPKVVTLAITQDLLPELNETFGISLVDISGGAGLGAQATATVTIVDDDATLIINNPALVANSWFGKAIATVGNRITVGIPGSTTATPGQVRVMQPSNGSLIASIANPFAGIGGIGSFGQTLARNGQNVIVGMGNYDGPWVFDVTTLASRGTLPLNMGASPLGWGKTLAGMLDGRYVVGSPDHSNNNGVFMTFSNATLGSLQQVDGVLSENRAASLAPFGPSLLVGCASTNNQSVRKFTGTPLIETLSIANPFPVFTPPGQRFGSAVSSLGNVVIVGAPGDNTAASGAGIVHLFDGTTGVWLQSILPPTVIASGGFGTKVLGIGNRICVHQPGGGTSGSGRVYVFSQTGALVQTINNPNPVAGGMFGTVLDEFDGVLVIGSPLDAVGATPAAGRVHIVKLN